MLAAAFGSNARGAFAAPTVIVIGTGVLQGTVTSADGAAIGRATITLTGNGITHTLPVGSQGAFVVNGLAAGTYILRASAPGYDTLSSRTIDVEIGKATVLDLVMTRSATKPRLS